jgi:hypothetical protein
VGGEGVEDGETVQRASMVLIHHPRFFRYGTSPIKRVFIDPAEFGTLDAAAFGVEFLAIQSAVEQQPMCFGIWVKRSVTDEHR